MSDDGPDPTRASFPNATISAALPQIKARFPNVAPLYFTKIFRGTITAPGLVWLDVDREVATPDDFPDLPYLLYCFEVYGQIVCLFAAYSAHEKEGGVSVRGMGEMVELQCALADYRMRLLKLAKNSIFEVRLNAP